MQTGVTVGTNDPSIPNSVTRILQHSILQLCNEHIGYNHTLQVLGVLCLTIDDRQQELVVKVNNTLKRVNPVTPPKDALLQPPTVPRADQELCFSAAEVPLMLEGGCPNGAFLAKMGDRVQAGVRNLSAGFLLGKARRKVHGRKQSNPVRVKHVYDEVDGEISGGDVLTVEPTNPEAVCVGEKQQPRGERSIEVGISHLTRKRIGGIRKAKRKLDDVFSTQGNDSTVAASTPASPSLITRLDSCDSKEFWAADASRQSPEGAAACRKNYDETVERTNIFNDLVDESLDSDCGRRLVVIAPDCSPENLDDPGTPVAEVGALNFSMCALNGGTPQPGKGDGGGATSANTDDTPAQNHAQEFPNCLQGTVNGIRIKEEVKGTYPLGLDLAMNTGGFDVSQNLAVRTSFLGDSRFFPVVHSSLTNGHVLASQNSLGSELCSTANPALRYLGDAAAAANIQLLDKAYLHSMVSGFSMAQVAMGPASYAISSCLKDGLTMHLTKSRTKDHSLLAGTSTKVKDIIMYDDSAPLHTQKGSKIEGDFMLDSLNVEGKKRRRRTAEDTLTAEEIAEYMGSCDRAPCSFKCKYCNEMCTDLSRYFNHTLLKHNSFICHQCGKNFTTKSSLLRHRPIHTGMRRFACSICKKSFYRKDKCKAHIKRHLGLSSDYPDKYPSVNFATS